MSWGIRMSTYGHVKMEFFKEFPRNLLVGNSNRIKYNQTSFLIIFYYQGLIPLTFFLPGIVMMFCLHMVAEGRPTIEFIMLVNMPSYWTALLGPIVVIFSVQNYRKFVWRLFTCHKQQQLNPTKTIVVGPTTASSIFFEKFIQKCINNCVFSA